MITVVPLPSTPALEPARRPAPGAADPCVVEAFATHRARLVRMAWARTRDEALAEDVVQEAFFRLAREVGSGRVPENTAGWLHRVAMNLIVSRARHQHVADRWAPSLLPGVAAGPEAEVVGRDRLRRVEDLIEGLPAAQRAAIVLVAEGRRPAEIALALGKSEAAARTLVCRARATLRAGLDDQEAA